MQQSYFSQSSKPPQRRGLIAVAKTRTQFRGLRLEAPDGLLWFLLVLLVGVFLMAGPARAADSPTELKMPEPWLFLSPDSISFAVIHARKDDDGVRSLLDTAWQGLKNSNSTATTGVMGMMLRVIQGDKSNGLISFLPLQMVRVDSMTPDSDEPHPTIAVTVAGWAGLQAPVYMMLSRGEDGKAYPTKDLEDATLVLREAWEDPTRSHVMTRVDGTFVAFPTVKKAEATVKALTSDKPARPKGELSDLVTTLDASRDTYGVLLNRKGSLVKFLTWLNKHEVARAQAAVGQEHMNAVMGNVTSMTWEGDLVSDNEMTFFLRFRTTSPEARKELGTLLTEVREVLSSLGRAGEMKTTGIGSELQVDFTMVGYRDMINSYISSSL